MGWVSLTTDGHVTVSDVTGSGPYQSTLILEEADTGLYTCTASASPENFPFVTASDNGLEAVQVTVGEWLYTCIPCCKFPGSYHCGRSCRTGHILCSCCIYT